MNRIQVSLIGALLVFGAALPPEVPAAQTVPSSSVQTLPDFADLHIPAVTGWGQEEDRRKAREAGFDSHFTKPLSPTSLHDLLATVEHRIVTGQDAVNTPRTRLTDSGYST